MDTNKEALRRLWRARLDPSPEASELAARLKAWIAGRGSEVVLATLPLPGEPDLRPWMESWLALGGLLALARTAAGSMDFGYVPHLDGPWTQHGTLREPGPKAAPWIPGPATLVLVPGLAFAPAPGGVIRLGRGGGYFDRWLAVNKKHVTTLGIGAPNQLTDTLPREPHDVLLDGWLDAEGFHGLEPRTRQS